MKRQKLNAKNIAVVFGTFAPMHTGHVDLIQQAKRDCDQVLVVVSGTNTDRDRGTQIGLHLNRRFRYVREVFRDDDLAIVEKLDEENMPAYPDGWQPWLEALHAIIHNHDLPASTNITFYVGEDEYQEPLRDYFAKFYQTKTRLIERSSIPISATQIRSNPYDYWRYITKPFRRHFTKKVLVIGSASGGKTTLVKDLGRAYNAPVSLEYARTYQDLYNVRDEELDVNDYVHLLADQYQQTANVIDSGSHSGLVFADTNSAVTMAYINYYLRDSISPDKYAMLEQLYNATFEREQWDLVILIAPETEYVDDGFRDMTMSGQEIRDEFTNYLLELMEPFKDKLFILKHEDTEKSFFAENYEKAKTLIKEKLGFEV